MAGRTSRATWQLLFAGILVLAPMPNLASAADDVEDLRQELQELRQRDEDNRRRLQQLEERLQRLDVPAAAPAPAAAADASSDAAAAALDAALEGASGEPAPRNDLWSVRARGAEVRLIDVSFDVLTAVGTSTETTDGIQDLQSGAHDPIRRGFTLQQAELSLMGAVDPYFTAEAHIIFIPEGVEFEEGFFQTTSLPYGLQLEGGHFLTEFGIMNPTHPHAWDWIDQPIINGRVFGGDGTRSPGFRLGWLTPLPWFSELHFGMQNATEDSYTPSFIGNSVGGRPTLDRDVRSLADLLYLARWKNAWDLTDEWSAALGVSGLYGPNNSGSDGETWIYGTDLKVRWRPTRNFRGWPFVVWQTEAIKRDYTADWFVAGSDSSGGSSSEDCFCHGGHCHPEGCDQVTDGGESEFPNDLPGDILRDTGVYTQLLYGFHYGWAAGVRYEYASGSGPSVLDGELTSRQNDPSRDDRHRLSPLLVWHPSEFSRLRLQYNFDHAGHLADGDAHTLWLGAEVLYGAHPAHAY